MPLFLVVTVIAVIRYVLRPILAIFSDKQSQPVKGAGRTPPDPDLYPHYMQNNQGLWLHWRSWFPAGRSRGVVVLCHGLAEHIGRYEGHANWLVSKGFVVFMMEHQGHGSSEGDRKFVANFYNYVDDQELFVRSVVIAKHADLAELPRFLLAHSMGGLIGSHLAHRTQHLWKGVVLSGPLLKPDPKTATPLLRKLAGLLSGFTPKLAITPIDADGVCLNKQVVDFYKQDPIVPQSNLMVRFGAEMLRGMDDMLNTKASTFALPLLIVHGEQDKLCAVDGSREFVAKVKSTEKRLIVFPKLYHEILNEDVESRQKVRDAILQFYDGLLQ